MKRYLNFQKYTECQLVTAINAAIFFGEPGVDPDSEEYERLVDLVSARHGSAISIKKALDYLRLKRETVPCRFASFQRALRDGCPIETGVWHRSVGFHSVLITGIRRRQLTIQNFKHGTNKHQQLSWAKLMAMRERYRGLRGNMGDTYRFSVDPWHLREKVWNLYHELNPAPRVKDAHEWFQQPRKAFKGLTPHDMCIKKRDPKRVSEFIKSNPGKWSLAGGASEI